MGKKSKIKQIRRIASQMPVFNIAVTKSEKIAGTEVVKLGLKEIDGKPVAENKEYRRIFKGAQPINHTKKMKRIYNQQGILGVQAYIKAVETYEKQEKEKLTPRESEQEKPG